MMDRQQGQFGKSPIRVQRYIGMLIALWTVAIGVVLTWELFDERDQAIAEARSEALGIWKKEYAVYRWAVSQGVVYVPSTDQTHPDANLAEVPDRDITTPGGRPLTLISPPMIMRQVFAYNQAESQVQGHVCSLHPIQPRNAPDPWERAALESFETGRDEVYSVDKLDDKSYLRLMRPLITEPSCLTCHFEKGHKVGDIRGGLSVSLPMASVWSTQKEDILHRIAGYGGMWLLGVFGILFMSRHLKHQVYQRYQAEQRLQEANDLLERRVEERTTELVEANRHLENEIVERRQAEQWLLESEERFRGYFEQSLVGMAILSAEQEWVEVNERLCKMLGYTEEELFVKPWRDLPPPEHAAPIQQQFERLLQGLSRGFVTDAPLQRKDGRTIPVGLSAQCLRKSDGTIESILVLVQDMTHRHAS